MSFLPLYIYFIASSFLASLIIFIKPDHSYPYLRLFPFFLLATLIAEGIGSYRSATNQSNLDIYNFFSVFEFFFYLWIISIIVNKKSAKKILRITSITYVIIAVINIIYIQKMKSFHTVTYSFGCLLIVIACIYYFLELFRLPKSVKLQNNPSFWLCSGLLFFYCCGFPLYGLVNYWADISQLVIDNFDKIFTILNIFLYTLFTIAFLCLIKTRKYT